jgi:hypothetical protein
MMANHFESKVPKTWVTACGLVMDLQTIGMVAFRIPRLRDDHHKESPRQPGSRDYCPFA